MARPTTMMIVALVTRLVLQLMSSPAPRMPSTDSAHLILPGLRETAAINLTSLE